MLDDVIRSGAEATLTWLGTKDPGLKQLIDKSYGCAVFPAVGRASAVLGCSRGQGAVFEHGKPIGFATVTQLTLGVQVGGETYSELLIFSNKEALEAFKKGKLAFAANASAVIVKAGGTGTTDVSGIVAKAYQRGGMLLELSLGGQKFNYFKHLGKSKKRGKGAKGEEESRLGAGAHGRNGEQEEQQAKQRMTEGAEAVAEQHGEEEIEAKRAEGAPPQGTGNGGEQVHAAEGEEVDPPEDPQGERQDDPVDPPGENADDPPGEGSNENTRVARAAGSRGSHDGHTEAEVAEKDPHHNGGGNGATSLRQRLQGRLKGSGRKLVGNIAHFVSEHGAPHGLDRIGSSIAAKRHPKLIGKPLALLHKVGDAATGLAKEAKIGPTLSDEVDAAVRRMVEHDPGIRGLLDRAYGYAVFPMVGKASAVLGVGYGRGEVFERGQMIGYGAVVQVLLGVQVGGQTYDELIVFENAGALERFKSENLAFAMNASAVLVRAGAAATTNYSSGTAVFIHPEGGMAFELSLGGQKFIYRKKGMGAPPPKFLRGGDFLKQGASRPEGAEAQPAESRGAEETAEAQSGEPEPQEAEETAEAQSAEPEPQEAEETAEAQSAEPEEGVEETAEAQGAEPEPEEYEEEPAEAQSAEAEEYGEEPAEAKGAEAEEYEEEPAEAQGAEAEGYEEEPAEAQSAEPEPEPVETREAQPRRPQPRSPTPRGGTTKPERTPKAGKPMTHAPSKGGRT
ncbi:hypothetical protein AKJ09_01656 [Labilithrix luteola]|uniref:Ysc84 actin-binding domain-containing protein n=1 Tax=Labilithrix luteola TaxID=1391654 RepID=A0A0K1PNA1_9BACT|nr:hypothetical protein [Labilithrix luteola]AKU94992.1 hypothetical protein AKJ09_01656 [Labilithrix luteola]